MKESEHRQEPRAPMETGYNSAYDVPGWLVTLTSMVKLPGLVLEQSAASVGRWIRDTAWRWEESAGFRWAAEELGSPGVRWYQLQVRLIPMENRVSPGFLAGARKAINEVRQIEEFINRRRELEQRENQDQED